MKNKVLPTLAAIVLTACSTLNGNLITTKYREDGKTKIVEIDNPNTPYLDEIHYYIHDKEFKNVIETDYQVIERNIELYPSKIVTTEEVFKKTPEGLAPDHINKITEYNDGRKATYERLPHPYNNIIEKERKIKQLEKSFDNIDGNTT